MTKSLNTIAWHKQILDALGQKTESVLAWPPAGFIYICIELLHRPHKDPVGIFGFAEQLLQERIEEFVSYTLC